MIQLLFLPYININALYEKKIILKTSLSARQAAFCERDDCRLRNEEVESKSLLNKFSLTYSMASVFTEQLITIQLDYEDRHFHSINTSMPLKNRHSAKYNPVLQLLNQPISKADLEPKSEFEKSDIRL